MESILLRACLYLVPPLCLINELRYLSTGAGYCVPYTETRLKLIVFSEVFLKSVLLSLEAALLSFLCFI